MDDYGEPHALSAEESQPITADQTDHLGLARDRNRVVVDLRNYRLPNRCLITNEPVAGEPSPTCFYTWELLLPRAEAEGDVKNAVRSNWSLGPLRVMAIAMRAPLQPRFQHRSNRLGFGLLLLGMAVAIVGFILATIGVFAWQWPAPVISIPCIVGAALVATGARALIRRHAPLTIHRFSDGFVWLNGVHPGIREVLSPWRNSEAEKTHRKRVARAQLGFGGVTMIIGAVMFAFQYDDAMDALASHRWPATPGMITSSQVVSKQIGGGKHGPRRHEFEVHIKYSFRVQDTTYSGSRVNFRGPQKHFSQSSATDELQRSFGAGRAVTVYYHPGDPQRCTLSPATVSEAIVIAVPPVLALAFGAGSLIFGGLTTWTMKSRDKTQAPQVG